MDDQNSSDLLPPHDGTIEVAALQCVVEAGVAGSQQQVDEFLRLLRPSYFYELCNGNFHRALVHMRMANQAIDLITLHKWFDSHNLWAEVGGKERATEAYTGVLPGMSYMNFSAYLDTLKKLALRREAVKAAQTMVVEAMAGDVDVDGLQTTLSGVLEKVSRASDDDRPVLEIVTVAEAKAYVPDPKTFLVGADMIALGELTVIGGLPGLGKSRLANTLAFAGARGEGEWMGYVIRRKWRTLVLQAENSMRRIQSEVADLPDDLAEHIRFSKPTALQFSSPAFRNAVRRYWDTWPFDMLIVDPWSDVVRDEKFADYQEALENVVASMPAGEKRPALVVVAHLKKAVLGDKRMIGRQLMGQVSGSMRLMQKARTAFMLQPASDDTGDDRVVFDCGKSNNDQPLPMSAWFRRNGQFVQCPTFDFEEWLLPSERERKSVTEEILAELFDGGKRKAAKRILVEDLKLRGFSQPTAYRALDAKGKFAGLIVESDGLLEWKGAKAA